MPDAISKDLKHDIKKLEECEHLMATGRVHDARQVMNSLLMLKKITVTRKKPVKKRTTKK
jgi:hypothetical protein